MPMSWQKKMSDRAEVSLVSFAEEASFHKDGRLTLEFIDKSYIRLIKILKQADIIHCFRVYDLVTDISVIFGKILKKKIFITDIGECRLSSRRL